MTLSEKTRYLLAGAAAAAIGLLVGVPTLLEVLQPERSWAQQLSGQTAAAVQHVATDAALTGLVTGSFPNGVWRDHFYTGGSSDGPLFFQPQTGTCVANGRANDGGDCRNTTSGDGNSFLAVHQHGVLDVKEFGAKGDNSTDDTAAFQAAVAAMQVQGSFAYAKLVVPYGLYCIKTGPIVMSHMNDVMEGIGNNMAQLNACGADVSILTLSGQQVELRNIAITGSQTLATANDTITLSGGSVNITNIVAAYGRYVMNVSSANTNIISSYLRASYGQAVLNMQTGSGIYARGVNFDNSWPFGSGPPAAGSQTLPNWAATTGYTAGNVVINGNFYLQAMTTGTSGGSAPTNLAYGQTINDGSVTWQLAGPYYAASSALIKTTGSAVVYVDQSDFTAPYAIGVYATSQTGQVVITDSSIKTVQQGINADGSPGFSLTVKGNQIASGAWNQATGISINTGGDLSATNNTIFGMQRGLWLAATGGHSHINNNDITGATFQCIAIAANVSDWSVVNNNLGTSAMSGGSACAASLVAAAGSSDYFNVSHNNTHGASAGIDVSGATGVHKTVLGNN